MGSGKCHRGYQKESLGYWMAVAGLDIFLIYIVGVLEACSDNLPRCLLDDCLQGQQGVYDDECFPDMCEQE